MATLNDLVTFDISQLFNGAVDVDWLTNDNAKAVKAAQSFVFHGPTYHAVAQEEVAGTGHKLVDTATFAWKTVSGLTTGHSNNPFVLAIAGFGSGKSHLAVTLAGLLSSTDELQTKILQNIAQADGDIAVSLKTALLHIGKILVVTLNGMNNGDLSSALLAAVKRRIEADNLDASPLYNLKGRFRDAANSVKMVDPVLISPLFEATGLASKEEVIAKLEDYDESAYKQVRDFLRTIGLSLRAFGDETAKDILNTVAQEYIGEGKPYSRMLVLFDEFGHYMEFATSHPQIAGDGALQQLFEGVQSNEDTVTFIGFIQYELKAYEQRLPGQYKNEIRRFITRFDLAAKDYLSSNLETLVASLLSKASAPQVDTNAAHNMRHCIAAWFPISQNYAAWRDEEMFARVIAGGCWPLAPLAMWVLFSLSASGKYLQNRSALTLLNAALKANGTMAFTRADTLPPVSLWTDDLQSEFENIEDELGRGVVMQSYNAVLDKHGQYLAKKEIDVLRAIVLLAQTQLKASNKDDVLRALGAFTGLDGKTIAAVIVELAENKNVIAYDEAARRFDIMGDSVSRSQFLRVLRTKAAAYDKERVGKLFVGNIEKYLPDMLRKIEGSFGQEHSISTPEWGYTPKYTSWQIFRLTLANHVKDLRNETEFMPVDASAVRGRIIYCYVSGDEILDDVTAEAQHMLQKEAKGTAILLTFIQENAEESISKALIDLDIMANELSAEEKSQFGRLVLAHSNKQMESLRLAIDVALHERNTITPHSTIPKGRLVNMADALFDKIYDKVIPFDFDGFSTGRGAAAKDCAQFTRRLLMGELNYDDTRTMPVAQRNRIQAVLNASWKIFGHNGSVTLQKSPQKVRLLVQTWEEKFTESGGLNLRDAILIACAAPYGANIASAGLLFSSFCQAKRNMTALMRHDEQVSFDAVIEEIFSNNFLNPAALSALTLLRTEGVNSEWEQFISDWHNSVSYRARIEYLEKCDELQRRVPIPPILKAQKQALTEMAELAQRTMVEADKKENNALEKIFGENVVQQGKMGSVAYGASLLKSWLDQKAQDSLWEWDQDIAPLVERVNEAKQIIQRDFYAWLARQAPRNSTAEAITALRDKLNKMRNNLNNLGLDTLKNAVNKRYEGISRSFNAINGARTQIDVADSWLATNRVPPPGTTLLQLKQIEENAEEQMTLLKTVQTDMTRREETSIVEELTVRIDKIKAIQTEVRSQEKDIKKRAEKIWGTELTVDTAQSIVDEAVSLLRLYEGSGNDTGDFLTMRDCVQAFLEQARLLDNLHIPEAEFEKMQTEGKANFVERYGEDEPPWNLEEAFDTMVANIANQRRLASKEWTDRMKSLFANASNLSIEALNDALMNISRTPPYFNKNEKIIIDNLRNNINKILEDKGVEWLYEKFKHLSQSGKETFLNLIKNFQ